MSKLDRMNVEDMLALAPNQEGILYHYLQNPKGDQYNIQLTLNLKGHVEVLRFEKAWQCVVQGNEMLRTVFSWIGIKQPVQVILKKHECNVDYYDFSEDIASIKPFIEKDGREQFDLEKGCHRIKLCKLKQNEYVIIMSIHHIIYDGWSNGVLWGEFFSIYNSLCSGGEVHLLKKTKYRQYIKMITKQDKKAQENFWKNTLGDKDESTILKENNMPNKTEKKTVINIRKEMNLELKALMPSFLKRHDLSLANFIYSAWGMLLQFYCNCNDVVFGRVSSGRDIELDGIQNMIGMFINVNPFRIQLDKDMTVCEYLKNVKSNVLELKSYETTPLYDIKGYIGIRSNVELFNSIVVIENYPIDKTVLDKFGTFTVEGFSSREVNHYDLTLSVEAFDDIKLNIMFNGEVFSEPFIEKLICHFNNILKSMIENENLTISEIQILDQDESNIILKKFNDTNSPFNEQKNVIDLFEEQVMSNPNSVAITCNGLSLTYKEFNEKANKMAHHLRTLGVERNTVVGIMIDRTIDMMIGIYGIIKAGGAYLPIDPHNPAKRINYIIEDAGINIILTQDTYKSYLNLDIEVIDITEVGNLKLSKLNPVKITKPKDSCYVIYTSGTTGEPKGVIIEHESLINRLHWMQKNTPIGNGDVVIQKTTYVFDVSVWELFWWGIEGAHLCLLKSGSEKNPEELAKEIEGHKVTTIHFVPSMLNAFLLYLESIKNPKTLSSLKYVLVSGEVLTLEMVRRFNQATQCNNAVRLVNLYGPTEATIDVSYYNCPRDVSDLPSIPIGRPIDNTGLFVIAPNGQMQPVNVPGELCIGGVGLARGYMNKKELTSSKFVKSVFLNGERVYKTGDLAKWTLDGTIEYLGRIDNQVKVRGYRIELGEIESVIRKYEGTEDVIVMVKQYDDGENYLSAYLLSSLDIDIFNLKKSLEAELPNYMIPAYIIKLSEFPVKSNGKVDKVELASIKLNENSEQKQEIVGYHNDSQKTILDIWKEVIPNVEIGITDNFFDIGGNSINLVRVYSKLQPHFPEKISITSLFQYSTVLSLSDYLNENSKLEVAVSKLKNEEENVQQVGVGEIAIIGMAGRFPGANTVKDYWQNILKGKESIYFFTDEELKEANVDEELIKNSNYVNAIGKIDGEKAFDSKFFEYSPIEAQLMDPQARLFMEIVWETLEDSGYSTDLHDEVIGLYAGASPNYFWETMALNSGKRKMIGDFATEKLVNKDYIATQISYKLNLTGPVLNVYTACSTSLVAVHLASQAILNNECTMAVAGGVSAISYYGNFGYVHQEGMVFSPDGHCRTFDRNGQGFVGGMGAGAVALKRLDKAIEDGDNIYAVIKGTAINNDGNRKIGYTAPSIEAQAEAVTMALKKAKIEPESIGYVETHGTGTPLGDPIEIKALELAFKSQEKNFCAVGSVKANIGHLDCAAGIAGLIKATLALKNETLPPAINFNVPNPKINFIDSPFYVNTEATEWIGNGKTLRAGVNAIGLGGTNAHVILEQYKAETIEKKQIDQMEILVISAMTETALNNQCNNLKKYIEENENVALEDIAFTLQVGRKAFNYRRAFMCGNRTTAIEKLSNLTADKVAKSVEISKVIFVFGNSKDLYKGFDEVYYNTNIIFQQEFDSCCDVVQSITNFNFKEAILHHRDFKVRVEQLNIERLFHFMFQYSRARCLERVGVKPSYLFGTGVGEILSGVLSGVLSLKVAIVLILNSTKSKIYEVSSKELEGILVQKSKVPFYSSKTNSWNDDSYIDNKNYWLDIDVNEKKLLETKVTQLMNKEEFNKMICISFDTDYDEVKVLGEVWEQGVRVNWKEYHIYDKCQRVSLPTYPFEKQEYWFEGDPFKKSSNNKDEVGGKKQDISEWFYIPSWDPAPLQNKEINNTYKWLLFIDDELLKSKLDEALSINNNFVVVRPGKEFKKICSNEYEINISNEEEYSVLLNELGRIGFVPDKIIHLLCTKEDYDNLEKAYEPAFLSILYLGKAISVLNTYEHVKLNVITKNCFSISGTENIQPQFSMVTSICLVLSQEITTIRCRQIDIDNQVAGSWKEEQLITQLINEFHEPISNPIIVYRNNKRLMRAYHQIQLKHQAQNPIKENGVYVLIGGLGGVGLVLSRYLAQSRVKLVLVGRSTFPSRDRWDEWVENNDPSNVISKKILKLKDIEHLGTEVCTMNADATNETQMEQLINDIEENYGRIDGVVYATVANDFSLFKSINEVTLSDCLQQFSPKINGIRVLEKAIGDRKLDFCLIMSSTSSVLGGLGFVAYSAANAYMDAFTIRHNQNHPTQWITVNWESWDVETNQNVFNYEAEIEELSMTAEQGCEAFKKILTLKDTEHVVISSGELLPRIEKWVYLNFLNEKMNIKGKTMELVSELTSEYSAPENKIEEIIAQVWSKFFGIAKVGIDDNLFELGATSLSIIQLNSNLRSKINRNIPIVKFFAYPTIRSFVKYLRDDEEESINLSMDRFEEVDKGRDSARKRMQLRKK